MKIEQHKGITLTEKQASLMPGYEMIVPDSVLVLADIAMFWQPQMDANYRKEKPKIKVELPDSQVPDSCVQEKLKRGTIWKQVNARIIELGIPNTKGNRKAIYVQLTMGRIE